MTSGINPVTSGVIPPMILQEMSGSNAAQSHSLPAAKTVETRSDTVGNVNKMTSEVDAAKTKEQIKGDKTLNQSDLGKQVQELQDIASLKGWSVNFSVDKDLGRTIIKVVDARTSDVIRQIPSEEWLSTAKKLKAFGEMTDTSQAKSQGDVSGLLFDKQV